jgi:hypothetical protein
MSGAVSELDIIVESVDAVRQRLAVRFSKADESRSVPQESSSLIDIDFVGLQTEYLKGDIQRYGDQLRQAILRDDQVDTVFRRALDASPLRIRLHVRADDARLQGLHWEAMTDPTGAPLSTLRNLAFSRYLPSNLPVRLRPASGALRALVAVASPGPEDQQKYDLAPIAFEQERLDRSMGNIAYDKMVGTPVTMNRLIDRLQAGEEPPNNGYDILYLVAHGTITRDDEPMLYLALETERERREMKRFRSGQQLALRMGRQLGEMPRLVVLASCTGAGVGMEDALYATGPRLALAGVPAVIAMKGFVDVEMVEAFLSEFFCAFQKVPEVDRAMQAARAHVQYNLLAKDWWAPVLFMRLTDGRLASGGGGWQRDQAEDEPAETGRPAPEMNDFDQMGLWLLMKAKLSREDLENATFSVEDLAYDEVEGNNLSSKAREMILWFKRRDRIGDLLKALSDVRPDQDWYKAAGMR